MYTKYLCRKKVRIAKLDFSSGYADKLMLQIEMLNCVTTEAVNFCSYLQI